MIRNDLDSSNRSNKNLQVLRGLSALLVLLFHINPSLFRFGYIGVDIFFYISGFLLIPRVIELTQKRNFKVGFFDFLSRRFRRLLPPLYVLLLIFNPLIFLLGFPSQHLDVLSLSASSLFGVANYGAYIFSGDYFEPRVNPYVHLWSLSAEEQCYLLTPIAIALIYILFKRKLDINKVPHLLVILLLAIQITLQSAPSIYSFFGISNGPAFEYYSIIPRLIEFSFGGIIAISKKKSEHLFALCAAVLIVTSLIVETSPTTIGMTLGCCLFFVCYRFLSIGKSKINKIFLWLGDRSYSIYLYHLPVIYFSEIYLSNLKYIVSPLITILLGHLSFTLIEKRYCLSSSELRFPLKRTFFFACIITLAIAAVVNKNYFGKLEKISVVRYDGTGSRFKDSFMNQRCISTLPCEFIKENNYSSKVLLVGDSRAEMYSKVFYDLALDANSNFATWTATGCRLIFDLTSFTSNANNCSNSNGELEGFLSLYKPDKIVVSQAIYSDSDLDGMMKTLERISSYTREVYLIGEIPLFPDEYSFLAQRPILSVKKQHPQYLPIRELNTAHLQAEEKIYKFSQQIGIDVIYVKPLFCTITQCRRFESGKWLYSDVSHLSSEGAKKAKTLFSRIFEVR